MAQRRMFSKKVTDTDLFLDMPLSAQALYFHLNMHADDDGFIGNINTIKRMVGASNDDEKLLIAKQLLIPFENSGVVVIRDWRIHNYIRKDTYNQTMYTQELDRLGIDGNGRYNVDDPSTASPRFVDTGKVRIGKSKDRLGKDRLETDKEIEPQNNQSSVVTQPKELLLNTLQDNGIFISPQSIAFDKIIAFHEDDGMEMAVITKAIEDASAAGKNNASYINGILTNKLSKNILTLEQYEKDERVWHSNQANRQAESDLTPEQAKWLADRQRKRERNATS